MKKKIVNGFLMLALLVSTMGTFVSCKDYDEDGFVDIRNRISNEASLREALDAQVKSLQASLDELKALAATHVTRPELSDSLKKYVRLEDYVKFKADTEAHFALLDQAISKLEQEIAWIKENMATKEELAELGVLVTEANKAASEAKALAQQALDLAKQNEKKIEDMQKDIAKNAEDIKTLNGLVNALQDELKAIKDRVTILENTVKTLEETITIWTERITQMNGRIDSIAAVMISYELRITALENQYDSLSIVVKNQGDSLAMLWLQVEQLNEKIIKIEQEWNKKITELQVQIINLSDEAIKIANEALVTAEAANAKASNAEQLAYHAVAVAEATAKAMEDAIKRAEDAAAKAEAAAKRAEDAAAKAEKAKNTCDSILTVIKTYNLNGCQCPADLEQRLAAAELAAKNADAKAEQAKTDAATAKTAADNAQAAANKAQQDATAALDKCKDLQDQIDALKKGTSCSCGDLKERVEKLEQADIVINNNITKIEGDITTINTTISNLQTALDNLKLDFANMITGIILQGTNNPVLGYLNVPADIRLNMLMAYIGVASEKFAFPAAGGKWVEEDERFTDPEITIMTNGSSLSAVEGYFVQNGGEVFAKNDGSDNVELGKVYVTVNPNTINFSGQTFTLENSRGQQSPVSLSPARGSYDLLTYGYDRTRSEANGFYEATAYMPISNAADIQLLFDIDGMKSKVKSAWKSKSKSDIISLAVDIYSTIDNMIEAEAVKASWTDSESKAHNIYSTYGVGCATVKPLSFNSLHLDRLKNGLPGKKFVNKMISKIINQIKIHFPVDYIDFNEYFNFNEVEILSGNQVKIDFTATINGTTQNYTVTIDLDQSEKDNLLKFVERAKIESENGSSVSVEVAKILNESLRAAWDKSIATAKEDMIDGLMKYVDKAFDKANSYINLYELFDINLIAHQTGKGFTFVSQIDNLPTKAEGTVRLYPTSNTAEYFAPAYKKYIAISNVLDANFSPVTDAAAKAQKAAAAGKNFNKVIDGDTYVELTGEAGYTYEVSYSAVDYWGLKTRKTFYVQF